MVIFKWLLNLLKCLIYHIIKEKKVCLCRVWIRLTTAYLLCAREFRQNNALALQFWCLSSALTLRVRALDASKSQRACIILSKFTRKSKYAVINYRLITAYLLLRVNLDKIMHARWDFDASSARTRRVSALDKHQHWSASALFCLNSRAQSKYAVFNLIHTRRKQTFLSFIMW